jgi:hypothetical protein
MFYEILLRGSLLIERIFCPLQCIVASDETGVALLLLRLS